MLTLGHIRFSNCLPVHARLLREPRAGIRIVTGVPSALNAALRAGGVDVAPCSSIEFARHQDRYRVLPGLAIASRGAVRSILLETTRAPGELDGLEVALPTASATSVVLLRALLEARAGARPRYRWFDQEAEDPLTTGAAAALWIGDAALRRGPRAGTTLVDLGTAWHEWTGLPFVYALWQTPLPAARGAELAALHRELRDARGWFAERVPELAHEYAADFGLTPAALAAYWAALSYELDASALEGLRHFFALAAELGEAPPVAALRWTPAGR
jgi:chorismate dehydratase